jgi:hypothetical protein
MSGGKKLLAVVILVGLAQAARADKEPAPKDAPPAEEATDFAVLVGNHAAPCSHKPKPCLAGWIRRKAACGQRLCEWLTYRPVRSCTECACHKECSPCGVPRLYIFFLCDGHGDEGCAGGACNGHAYGR